MLLDPLPIQTRKHSILNVHGLLVLLVGILQEHAYPLMRDIEPELLWQKERSVIYQSSLSIRNTIQGVKSVIHFHLIRSIVDVVRMEQRIQNRTIHKAANPELMNNCVTFPCHRKRDSVMNSTSSKAMCLTKSFSSVMSVFLSSTWDDLGSNHNSPISWREYVMEHCEFKGTDSVRNAYR